MNTPLDSLERKVDAVLALCEQLQRENASLRAELATQQGLSKTLSATIDSTRERLELLMTRLPEDV